MLWREWRCVELSRALLSVETADCAGVVRGSGSVFLLLAGRAVGDEHWRPRGCCLLGTGGTGRATSLSEDERELSLRCLDFSSMLVLGRVGSIV